VAGHRRSFDDAKVPFVSATWVCVLSPSWLAITFRPLLATSQSPLESGSPPGPVHLYLDALPPTSIACASCHPIECESFDLWFESLFSFSCQFAYLIDNLLQFEAGCYGAHRIVNGIVEKETGNNFFGKGIYLYRDEYLVDSTYFIGLRGAFLPNYYIKSRLVVN